MASALPIMLGALVAGAESVETLGGFPVCEASAALIIPCPEQPHARCLLVGDNEQSQALYAYSIESDAIDGVHVDVSSRRVVDIGALLARDSGGDANGRSEISDIEALALLSSGEILVYGSHGRNRSCDRKGKRRRWLGLRFEAGRAVAGEVGLVRTAKKVSLEEAFGREPVGLMAEVAGVVREAERAADGGDCRAALDIEGAAVAPQPSAGSRESVWLGLRSPLVRGHAVLARHDPLARELRFDAVRLIDLDGQGIRGLSVADGYVWGLSASSAGAESQSHRLWRFPLEAIQGDAGKRVIAVEAVAEVPARSEGLAVSADVIFVVADGRVGDGVCELEASHFRLLRPGEGGSE